MSTMKEFLENALNEASPDLKSPQYRIPNHMEVIKTVADDAIRFYRAAWQGFGRGGDKLKDNHLKQSKNALRDIAKLANRLIKDIEKEK